MKFTFVLQLLISSQRKVAMSTFPRIMTCRLTTWCSHSEELVHWSRTGLHPDSSAEFLSLSEPCIPFRRVGRESVLEKSSDEWDAEKAPRRERPWYRQAPTKSTRWWCGWWPSGVLEMLSRPLHVSDEEKQGSEKSMHKISNLQLSKWFTERGDPKLPPGLPRVNKSAATLAFPRRSTSTLGEPHDLRARTERTTPPVREGLRSVTGNACLHPTPNASSSWAA